MFVISEITNGEAYGEQDSVQPPSEMKFYDNTVAVATADAMEKSVIVLQTYTRFVEIGRIAYVAFGPDVGKLVAIVDVIDQNRVCLFIGSHYCVWIVVCPLLKIDLNIQSRHNGSFSVYICRVMLYECWLGNSNAEMWQAFILWLANVCCV